MKKFTFIAITAITIAVIASVLSTTVTAREHLDISKDLTRDLAYEAYCDSIYEADPDYYLDVLTETDEYQEYLEIHGEWWAE